jgi:hypothetical protein
MSEENALLALKNAWNGAVTASDEIRSLAPAVNGLSSTTPLAELDLDTYERLTVAQANAVMALRGLIEQLRRIRESA